MKKFGTFGGVFTPSLLTILGVIMYLRMGWVVGNAGTLAMVLGIIFLAHVVSVTTGLSISSIATDKKIKSGGIYYILSRSLGFSFGGAIGLTLYAATALSISLYLIGFSESLLLVLQDFLNIETISLNHLRLVATLALLAIVTIAYISTSFAIKTQYIILSAIALSLLSIFLGTSEGKGFDFSAVNLEDAPGFAVIFGVFFPAVTGFTAGVAMSGDLKNPAKSIPWGTLLAIVAGLIVYTGLALFIYTRIPAAELVKNNNALVEFSWIPQLVVAGIWGATLSSALGGILGGPRILQSMSIDKITPRIFGKGVGKENEPRNALLLTFFLAEAGILIGELNVIAGVVAMFYMAAYLVINLSCFLEKWASPDFRPKFKINIFIPLVGVVTIFLLMIQLNIAATLASIIIIGAVFVFLTRKQLVLSSGDVWSSVWSSVVKLGLKNLDKKPKNKRNWEPNILLFSGGTEARPHLISMSKAIAGKGGMISNFDLIETPAAKTLFPKRDQALEQDNLKDGIVFHRRQECNSLFKGIEAIASTYGFSGIEPNTTLMGWARNTADPIWFANMNQKLNALDYNILYLDYDKRKGFGSFNQIDIWWNNINNVSELTTQIAKRIVTSNDWRSAEIRILYLNNEHQKTIVESLILEHFASLRLDFPFEIIDNQIEKKPFYEVVKKHSQDADLIIVEIPQMKPGDESTFVQATNKFLSEMGTTLLVSASDSFTTNTQELFKIEQSYNQRLTNLKLETADLEPLVASGYTRLDETITNVDTNLTTINHHTTTSIYASIIDVYKTFFNLLREDFEQNRDQSALSLIAIKQRLVEDLLSNKRFDPVAQSIQNALENHQKQINAVLAEVPKKLYRNYTAEELESKGNDSEQLLEIKSKLLKIPQEKIKLAKQFVSFYSNEYVENLATTTLLIGASSKTIIDFFIEWIMNLDDSKTINLEKLEVDLEAVFNTLSNHFLFTLNSSSRELANAVLKTSDSLNPENTSILQSRKTKRSSRDETAKFISNYPQNWLSNTQLLSNHLALSMQLKVLQIKTTHKITDALQAIENDILTSTLKTVEKCASKVDDITLDTINKLKKEIDNNTNQVNVDGALEAMQTDMERNITEIFDAVDVISQNDLIQFDNHQENISPTILYARRTTNSVIENEIFASILESYQRIFNQGRVEISKAENVLELLKFNLLDNVNGLKNKKAILKKANQQLTEAAENIKKIQVKQRVEQKELLSTLKNVLTIEAISLKEAEFEMPFHMMSKKKVFRPLKNLVENGFTRLHGFMVKSIDAVAQSEFEYRNKPLQNIHTKFADFSDLVSPSKETEKNLPFYYNQLFTGKHFAQTEFLENRKVELLAFKKAIDRFNTGKSGAILFTGEQLSGKTYLMQNAINQYSTKNVVYISPPSQGMLNDTKILDKTLANATGLEGDAVGILRQLRKKSTLVFEDLELWWTRSATGSNNLIQIIDLIKEFSNTHLFVMDCNTLFYQHVRQYLPIDEQLLATIITSTLPISEIEETIMKRHRSGGLKFIWENKSEDKLSSRELNRLFRKITALSSGNIGLAFHVWIGNIDDVEQNELYFSDYNIPPFPVLSNPVWENMITQFLMHKKLTLKRLKEIYSSEDSYDVENNLQSLTRAGIVVKTTSNSYRVSPFVLPYLMNNLRKKI